MLTYGGLGLLIGGIILTLFSGKIAKGDEEKAAKLKKQGPILAVVGAGFLILAVVLGRMLA
ncbi:MAG: hypothetical protein V3V15_03580 [Sphingorhabdus sp.]